MQKVLVELTDDLDGKPADETVRFGLGAQEYEIDLRDKHAKEFRRTLQPYVDAGRKKAAAHRVPGRPAAQRRRAAAIREWAREQGHMEGRRGRIPGWIEDEYDKVHGT